MTAFLVIVVAIIAFLAGLVIEYVSLKGSLFDEGYSLEFDPKYPRGHGRYQIFKINRTQL